MFDLVISIADGVEQGRAESSLPASSAGPRVDAFFSGQARPEGPARTSPNGRDSLAPGSAGQRASQNSVYGILLSGNVSWQ